MFGMEPSAQLQEYSTNFFHAIKPQKKKIIKKIPYITVTQEQRNIKWSENSIQQDERGQLRTVSDPMVSFKFDFSLS